MHYYPGYVNLFIYWSMIMFVSDRDTAVFLEAFPYSYYLFYIFNALIVIAVIRRFRR